MNQAIKKCAGCGITLQTEDKDKIGYAVSLDHTYCQSCFRLSHYGQATIHEHPDLLPEFKEPGVVFVITSVLFLDTLFQTNLNRLTSNKIVYIINQIDLLPTDTNLDFMLENIMKKARSLHIKYHDIILMSAQNLQDLLNLKTYIRQFKEKDIYLIGVQNSGKTTIFKALTENTAALSLKKAALTLETLTGSFENKTIYDTPGLYQKGYLHEHFSYDVYKTLLPEKRMRPTVYHLKASEALMLDGLVAIEVIKQVNDSYVFYTSPLVAMHKTKAIRIKPLLEAPKSIFKYGFNEYIQTTFSLPETIKYQVTFADFGFMHVTGPVTVTIWHPRFMHITQMEALFK